MELPADLEAEILSLRSVIWGTGHPLDVAVRSSATAEDLPDASFAGQQETYLNVQGHGALLHTCRRCFASLFTDRAISYRADKGFDHFKIALSIGVQRMVRSDLGGIGRHVHHRYRNRLSRRRADQRRLWPGRKHRAGVGQSRRILRLQADVETGIPADPAEDLGSKEFKLIYDIGGGKMVKNVPVPPGDRSRFAISDDEILPLARWACVIEDHYSAKKGAPTPMDIEWAKDGRTGELFIVQARPETVQSRKDADVIEIYQLKSARAGARSPGAASARRSRAGPVRVIKSVQFIGPVQRGRSPCHR